MNTLTTLTVISIAVAAAMTMIVLRLVFQERRRSAARVAALEADIYRTEEEDILVLHDPPLPVIEATRACPGTGARARLWRCRTACGGCGRDRVWHASRGCRDTAPHRLSRCVRRRHWPPIRSLQLLSLDHERAHDRLTVRGVVRNPPRGNEVDHLTAVVLLFNQQGGFLTSGRSPIESATLQPGTEAKFVVTVPGAADVGKYRVSFRTDDRVVPHVDRRW